MGRLKLLKLIVKGNSVCDSSIEFGSKLTIIAGPSDTGKTYIYRCISYIFGAASDKKHIPFDEDIEKYNTIVLETQTANGFITFTRKVRDGSTIVQSTDPEIEDGEYPLVASKKNPITISDVFLKIIGIPNDIVLPALVDGTTKKPTWRAYKDIFMIHEDKADKAESVFMPKGNTDGLGLFLACILYLRTGDDMLEYKNDAEGNKIKKAKRVAVQEYIQKLLKRNEDKRKEINSKLADLGTTGNTPESIMDSLTSKLEELNNTIDKAVNSNRSTAEQIIKLERSLARNRTSLTKYNNLETQYVADVERMSFIVENEGIVKQKKREVNCPYCDHLMIPKTNPAFINASKIELQKVKKNLNDLTETKISVLEQIDDDSTLLAHYKEIKKTTDLLLSETLLPQKKDIITLLEDYKNMISLDNEMNILVEVDKNYSDDYNDYNPADITSKEFYPKKIFFDIFNDDICNTAKDILNEVHYKPLETVEFDADLLDLKVNGKQKLNRGKGYKAFTNTIALLSFRKIMNEKAAINPRFYIFDSPLKGLSLPQGIDYTQNIRKGLFDYLVNNTSDDQLIIIENTDDCELPTLAETDEIKVYRFTRDENAEGRYGFLNGVYFK